MSGSPNKLSRFWQELKRRNVHRLMAIYAGTAYVIFEASTLIFPRWGLPDWTIDLVLYLLILGAIITYVIGWIYDITPEGVQKSKPLSEVQEREVSPTPNAWKIASYISALVIVILIVLNIIPRINNQEILDKSIAVLPFKSLSDDPEKQYLADGVMDAILLNLSKINDLRVIARTSVEQYRETDKTASEICQELGVGYVLEASFQKYDDQVRLIVQLIESGKEGHAWANDYQREWKEIFAVQSEVANLIARELQAVITSEEKQRIEQVPTAITPAYEVYLKGKFYERKWTTNDLDIAMRHYEMAIEMDPDYALAYAGVSDVWFMRQWSGIGFPDEIFDKSMAALDKALELDSTCAEVQYSLGSRRTWGLYDWEGGETAFKKAIALNPNHIEARYNYSHLLNIVGRPKEAMEQIELAHKLDPLNPALKAYYGVDLIFVRRYEEAIRMFQDALKMEPTYPVAIYNIAVALHMNGRYEESIENLISLYLILMDTVPIFDADYNEGDYISILNRAADKLVDLSKTTFINPTDPAMLYAQAGNKEQALKWLEEAYKIHEPNLPYLLYPIYDCLRDEPAFQELCRKMNLPYKSDLLQ